ncbi:hypothetical protein ABL78_4051 [Leptomonas seymouri]|uniref:Transmembrane protein n=1 Tax=Leptomonas seymouri TaxID=5684 RepID=A0A0N1HYR4_LEPSE|nr:hypothetical protein ABL78_4051 [Leptomonas seymouri]|eukprot:KPI86861.1 hypothetical protein ABL78_4051 [Leptomonas seymouri]
MNSTLVNTIRVVCWFWGLFPLCYYVALTVICGIHQRWISFGFALATAAVLAVWLILNGVAIFSAWALGCRRHVTTVDHMTANLLAGGVSRAPPPQVSALAPPSQPAAFSNTADNALCFNGSRAVNNTASEVDLSSLQESMMATVQNNVDGALLTPTTAEANGRDAADDNPLNPKVSVVARNRRGVTGRRQLSIVSEDYVYSEVEDTVILSPPKAERLQAQVPSKVAAQTPLSASPWLQMSTGHPSTTDVGKQVEPGRLANKCANVVTTVPQPLGYPNSTTYLNASRSASARAAFMMPTVSIYATIALTLLLLVASIFFEYETHCLMLALPALAVPGLWSALIPLGSFFDSSPAAAKSFHFGLLRFLTRSISITVIAVAGLAVYVAALTLEVTLWAPYMPENTPIPRAIRVVSYLSPIPMFIIVILFAVSSAVHARSVTRCGSNMRGDSEHGGVFTYSRSNESAVHLNVTMQPQQASKSPFRPLDDFEVNPDSPQVLSPPAALSPGQVQLAAPRGSTMTSPDCNDVSSTLSSIVRSSMNSISFVPSNSIVSPPKTSISRNHVRASRENSSCSAVQHSAALISHISTLPQLKSVTMLYLAYRNIYDDDCNANRGSFCHTSPQVGMAANRNLQQTISANYEALMEAIEDAHEQDTADANAYFTTAHGDALCLVWGLMPFTSDPVLLAIEKALKVMEAFRSRPKPPPTSTDEQLELVGAVVSKPHSLVGFIGQGNYRSLHFFNPHQHDGGSQLLRRALALYRRLPSAQNPLVVPDHPFRGILMNCRARNNTADRILARPCGIKWVSRSTTNNTAGATRGERRPPIGMTPKSTIDRFPVMYEFLDHVQAKEEEWHLVVQRQEHLGSRFSFLTEATQLLQQCDPVAARETLACAVESTDAGHDADNITVAQMMIEDIDRATGKTA